MSLWTDDVGLILDETGAVDCDDCPCEEEEEETTYVCTPCCATAPEQWTITLPAGFTNGDHCTACAGLSGASFVLSKDPGVCRWEYFEADYCPSCEVEGEPGDFDLLIALSLSSDFGTGNCLATLELQLIGPDDSACRGDIVTWQAVFEGSEPFCDGGVLAWVSSVLDGPACNNYPHSNVTLARG